ncbi:exocyst complex component 3-like [Mya arenaria]|uniref:exocyst complex component 3-like n=1 Tax=Mya arenaria TaxID=6604 RepID=UPI0022E95AB7|nr:exocyst complex component 3-like [Mya arenaria]XP_052762930.1 exocyst complex component 3-like [Mya arenaria]
MSESLLTPQAPLDLGRLEKQAKENGTKYVASLLQRPDQLERVDQYRRRVARKKASVETMLKTAVQSQLDGVRTGLNQLQSALHDVHEIKKSLDQVDEQYKRMGPLQKKIGTVLDENQKFCQLATAMENLKHIFTVPESVKKTEELINDGKLLYAHKHLTELETARDDLLFELHKQPNRSPTDDNTLQKYFADVAKLSVTLGKQLWIILQRVLMSVRREPTLIVTALRIIEREEKLDQISFKRKEQTGFMPPDRPKRWKDKCFSVMEEWISNRIEGNQMEDRSGNKMWLVRHLEVTRQIMLEDLRVAKTLLPAVFPPSYNIVNKFVWMYHNGLSKHIQEMISQQLEGNEFVSLLSWLNSYDSPELMKHPSLEINTKDLGPLLDDNQVKLLQTQYLTYMKANIQEWTGNTLKSEQKDWCRDEGPDQDGEGFYNTSLPVIIFQMIEQNIQVAMVLGKDIVISSLEQFVEVLSDFAEQLKGVVVIYKDRHLNDRREPKFYLHYLIATCNNLLTFGEYMKQLRKRYLKNEYDKEDDDETNSRNDRFLVLKDTFNKIAAAVVEYILDEVLIDLKNHEHCFNELMTKNWQQTGQAIEVIVATWHDYGTDFVHLKPNLEKQLYQKAKKIILKEYLKAILSKKLTFKQYEERKNAAEKMIKESEQLEFMFQKYKEDEEVTFAILPMMAESLKLKDTSMLSLEIAGMMKRFPDIRLDQMINLLLCRGDMSRSEARQMVIETVGEEKAQRSVNVGIFHELFNEMK